MSLCLHPKTFSYKILYLIMKLYWIYLLPIFFRDKMIRINVLVTRPSIIMKPRAHLATVSVSLCETSVVLLDGSIVIDVL